MDGLAEYFHGDAGDDVITGGQTIVQGDVNGVGLADIALILNGAQTLTAGDFLL